MKIAHTSDWHAGRLFKRVDRLPELQDVLANMADDLEREQVELLLMSGDVFDSGAPQAEAERAVFRFFRRLGQAGIRTAVIAGNHDSPARMEAWAALAELVDVSAVARPVPHDKGGLLRFQGRDGNTALVAAVPFASAGAFASGLQLAHDATGAYQRYAEAMRAVIANVTGPFRADTVNLLMLHTYLEGALFSGSERRVHLGEEWAAAPQALLASAHYVALGHIHKPQHLESAPGQAHYAGSPLQLDFGEAGEEKGFLLVDARPGQRARVERVPYRGARPLARVQMPLIELEREAATLRERGWLWVTVPLGAPDPDLNQKVRALLPNALRVEALLPPRELSVAALRSRHEGADPGQLYSDWCCAQHGGPPDEARLLAFRELLAEESHG